MPEPLAKTYNPKDVEERIYRMWEEAGCFEPETAYSKWQMANGKKKRARHTPYAISHKPFSMVLPPPNATGILHMGHALILTIEDVMARYHRMKGEKTLWLPGTDHAAIATQEKVERELYKKEGKRRQDLGREEFLRRVNEFVEANRATIKTQLKKMGASLDWSREAFTLDEPRTRAVHEAFKRMYDAGLIYRGERIVNWDPKLQTTVSDDEVEWREEKAPFYYLKYGPFVIATARPETKFGDKYVVMHPSDKRYAKWKHGDTLEVEWINGKVTATIIKDKAVDPKFGTGVMTITPWHDAADFDIAERHKLEKQQIIDAHGRLLPVAGEFTGKKILEARPLIVEKLKTKGLLEKVDENYTHRVATSQRGGGMIEPQIMKQWFVNVTANFRLPTSNIKGIKSGSKTTLKEIMLKPVQSGQIKIIPERFKKIYFHWVKNLRDWCISRQIWYGHRIPVWYCGERANAMKRMGFAGDIVAQVFDKKTRTYRLRDHGVQVGDRVAFEDSAKKIVFGYGTITEVTAATVGKIDLNDTKHWKTYSKRADLIAAFKRHHPEMKITNATPVWVYTYAFDGKLPTDGCGTIAVVSGTLKACPGCGRSENLTQDPDTLDTWFSSGLWTFSTLGWPSFAKASDGKPSIPKESQIYHPTTILETGYDILFFWVARMILMTGFLLGDAPFKTVYLNGLVRGEDRQKMSKSKGNTIDPLGIADIYGTDAVRMALIVGNAPGNDPIISEDKIRGYRNFATKIWNIARFIIMNNGQQPTTDDQQPAFTAADKKRLKEFAAFKKTVTKDMDEFRFHEASAKIYHYLWHTFADKIIEEAKPRLSGTDEKEKHAAYALLTEIFTGCLKLLHPFMPFVTEELYGKLIGQKTPLMIQPW